MADIFDDEFETYIGDLNTSNPENAVLRRSKGLMARSRRLAGPRKDMSVREIGGALAEGFKVVPGAMAAGAVEGFVGLPGDIESLVRGLVTMASRPEDQGKLEALLEGIEKETILPTMEDVQKFVNENITDFGDSPFETIGQFVAPAGYVKPIKKIVKSVSKKATAVATGSNLKEQKND
jgi:hypothetical protein